MISVLVTGSNGQLGKCIKKLENEYPNIAFVFQNHKELDITKVEDVNALFKSSNFDFCINGAAYTNVEEAERNPGVAFNVNAEGVANLARACGTYGVNLIHISTDYVFDGEKNTPYNVDDIPNPINVYGKSKLKGENYIQELIDNYFIIRTSWLYSEYGHNFYKTILHKAKTQDKIYVTDEQTGVPTNANNLARYILEMIYSLNKGKYGIYHFTDGKVMTWYSFAIHILKTNKMNTMSKIVKDNKYRSFVKRPKNTVLIGEVTST